MTDHFPTLVAASRIMGFSFDSFEWELINHPSWLATSRCIMRMKRWLVDGTPARCWSSMQNPFVRQNAHSIYIPSSIAYAFSTPVDAGLMMDLLNHHINFRH